MRNLSISCTLLLIAIFPALPSAYGAPSGLNTIPTADVLDDGAISLEIESSGTGRPWGDDYDHFSLIQLGFQGGVEMGVDMCLTDSSAWLNAKWRLCDESTHIPAIAVGVQSVSDKGRAQPYLIVLRSLGKARVHGGFLRDDGGTRWMAGLDTTLAGMVTFQTDYISGEEDSLTYGIAVPLSRQVSVTLVNSIGNLAGEHGHAINVAWSR